MCAATRRTTVNVSAPSVAATDTSLQLAIGYCPATRVRRAVVAQLDIAGNAPATRGWLHLDAKENSQ
jgi:hypothetical protein